MKKAKLNLQGLNSTEVLTRSQLKNVVGGLPVKPCYYACVVVVPGGNNYTTYTSEDLASCQANCFGGGTCFAEGACA